MTDNLPRHWMITGASGLLGYTLCKQLAEKNITVSALKSSHSVDIMNVQEYAVDITDQFSITKSINTLKPDVVIHAAGITNVDECERCPEYAHAVHVSGTTYIAQAAQLSGIPLVYISTDHLWDGTQSMVEEHMQTNPINCYAKTKREGETVALGMCKQAISIRTNFFGPGRPWRASFSDWILGNLQSGLKLKMFTDAYFTPISTHYLCQNIIELVRKNATGIYNVAGRVRRSKYEFSLLLAKAAGYSTCTIEKTSLADFHFDAPRPQDMSLNTNKITHFLQRPMPTTLESINSLKFLNI